MKLQLAKESKYQPSEYSDEWIFQEKLDGSRYCLLKEGNRISFLNRHQQINRYSQYPDLHTDFKNLPDGIYDGELIARTNDKPMGNFFLLLKRENAGMSKNRVLMHRIPLYYVIFDAIGLNGVDLTHLDYITRLKMLKENLKGKIFARIELINTYEKRNLDILENSIKALDGEGIMIKRKDSKYVFGKTNNVLKWKRSQIDEFEVAGYTSKTRDISALMLKKDGKDFGKVNMHIDKYIELIKNHSDTELPKLKPDEYRFKVEGLTAKVKFFEHNKNALRSPVLLKVEEK